MSVKLVVQKTTRVWSGDDGVFLGKCQHETIVVMTVDRHRIVWRRGSVEIHQKRGKAVLVA